MIRRIVTLALAATLTASLGLQATANAGPLTPIKYHTTTGVFQHADPNNTLPKLFVFYFDDLSPSGRTTVVQGTIGDNPFAGVAALVLYDKRNYHAVFDLVATANLNGAGVPLEGFIHVNYDRLGRVHKISIDGEINGEPFAVPPMVVTL